MNLVSLFNLLPWVHIMKILSMNLKPRSGFLSHWFIVLFLNLSMNRFA